MKLAIIGPVYPYRGGIALFTTLLAKALEAQGDATLVVSFRRQYPGWLYPGASDKDPSQEALRTPAEYLLDPLSPGAWRQSVRSIAAYQPDGVIIQWWTTFWAPPFAWISHSLRRRGFPVIYLLHNVLPHEPRPWDAALARLALSAGSAFLAQSPQERARLLKLLPGARLSMSPHPVYTTFAPQEQNGDHAASRLQARRQLGLPAEAALLLFFGIVRPYKGLDVLLAALGILRQAGICPRLVIAGEFWEGRSRYQEQIQQLGLQEQVDIFDTYIPNEQARQLFSAADLFIAPHIQATQSGAAELALGAGMPLIVTHPVAEGIPPALQTRLTVVPPASPQALANAIQAFLQLPDWASAPRRPAGSNWGEFVQVLKALIRPTPAADEQP